MTRWTIDPTHSEVAFKVKHLVISTATGRFETFHAAIDSEQEDFSDAKISFDADVASIQTKNEQRDAHLKSADFFDAAAYPKLSFVSTAVRKLSDEKLQVTGNLTMRGVTKEVILDATFNGLATGFDGSKIAGFEIHGKVNRFDFGLHWNALTETGGVAVGQDVRIEIQAEFQKVQRAAKAA